MCVYIYIIYYLYLPLPASQLVSLPHCHLPSHTVIYSRHSPALLSPALNGAVFLSLPVLNFNLKIKIKKIYKVAVSKVLVFGFLFSPFLSLSTPSHISHFFPYNSSTYYLYFLFLFLFFLIFRKQEKNSHFQKFTLGSPISSRSIFLFLQVSILLRSLCFNLFVCLCVCVCGSEIGFFYF